MMKTILMLVFAAVLAGCQTEGPIVRDAASAKPEFTIVAIHPVQKGETLSSICRQYYGRSDHDAIVLVTRANPDILMESTGSPQPHMTLRIPALPNKDK